MRTLFTRIVLTLGLLLLPVTAYADIAITAHDSVAGLGIPVTLSGLPEHFQAILYVQTPKHTTITVPVRSDSEGSAEVLVPGRETEHAGVYRMELRTGSHTVGESVTAEVLPDSLDNRTSGLEAASQTLRSDGNDEVAVTVTIDDRYGNVLPGRPIDIISSRTEDQISSRERETDERGEQHFFVRTRVPGSITLVAMDLLSQSIIGRIDLSADDAYGIGGPVSSSRFRADITETSIPRASARDFDVLDAFEVTLDPSDQVKQGDVLTVKLRAIDRNGRTVEDYVSNAVRITAPNDPDASLPGDLTGNGVGIVSFPKKGLGVKILPLAVSFQTSGEQILHVEDRTDPRHIISGEVMVTVRSTGDIPNSRRIQITSPEEGGSVNTTSIHIRGKGPAYANLEVMVTGGKDAAGETDANGTFDIPVELDATEQSFAVKISDETGKYKSETVHFRLDTSKPRITSITFAPEKPEQGGTVLAVVKVENQTPLSSVTLTVGEIETTLIENPKTPGTYQGLFTAGEAGTIQPTVTAVSASGNREQVKGILVIGNPGLSLVKNVKGSAMPNAVALTWDEVKDAKKYRIYVGEDPGNFLYNLDTDKPVTTATVAGLKPGTLYYFAVTALADDRESSEKSAPVSARPIGLEFVVKPANTSLVLQWNVSAELQKRLASFVIEYGIEADHFIEKRIVSSQIVLFTIRDLLPGVTYFVRMTPVSLTGEVLKDLATDGQGVPASPGSDFMPTPSEPAPILPVGQSPALKQPLHRGAPLESVGLPSPVLWTLAIIASLVIAFVWQRQRQKRLMLAFMRAMQNQYQ